MKKTIHRHLEFTADDIKEALLALLENQDHPVPREAFEFKLTTDGAKMSWSETIG